MAVSSTSFKKGENGGSRGKSFKNKLLDTIKEYALLDVGPKASKQEIEKAYLKHTATRAFDATEQGSGVLLKELLNKSYPSMKAVMPEFEFDYELTNSPTEQVNQIIKAASDGKIPPDVATIFLQAVKAATDIEVATELRERMEKLEGMINA
ncbi:hypothetical protein KAR91_53710 [Candidatus Pacearchaeota archaeon]|nr:hypothetical protein [Candidatus Pacearchaeota archaeon]